MKIKHLLLFGWAAAMIGCTDQIEDDLNVGKPQEGLEIFIEGNINQQYHSRVDDGGFCDGDQIGLYGVNYTDGNTVAGTLQDEGNQVDNIRYTYDEKNFKWTSTTPAYYKDVNTHIDLYAYYPYGSPSSTSAYEFEVAMDQNNNGGYAASDFLWAKAEKVEPSENNVRLHFSHRLSCANVILSEGDNFADGEFAKLEKSVIVMNTTPTSTINLATGKVTATGEASSKGILMMDGQDGFRAIVIPQTVEANATLFAITVDGITYRFKTDKEFIYQPGKQSKFTIKVNRKEATGEYEFTLVNTEISEWIADLDTHGGEARQYYVVHMEQPGTLGELIAADKKNPNKIKNLKISGKVDERDFNFMHDNMDILQAVNMKESTIVESWYCYVYLDNEERELYFEGKMPESESERENMLREKYPDLLSSNWQVSDYYETGIANHIPSGAFLNKSTLVYFSFPENVTNIGSYAFNNTLLSGALVIPNEVSNIGSGAFAGTNISSLELPHYLKRIGSNAFENCVSLAGTLSLPESLEELGEYAFQGCKLLSGSLSIPSNMKVIENRCFYNCGFTGDLTIPEGVTSIGDYSFANCSNLNGQLTLPNSLKEIGAEAFYNCNFQGELYIPSQIQVIPNTCFALNEFSSIIFPENSEILKINGSAFAQNQRLTEPVILPKELITLGDRAFVDCQMLPQVVIPATTATIGEYAFSGCHALTSLTCEATLPPTLGKGVFNGVPKDNFTLEVPEQSVPRYQTQPGWNDFKRISAHHDFSISRPLLRTLNAIYSKTYTLRAPVNQSWSIQSKPEWVTVTPSEGVGKMDVTITVSEMEPTDATFEITTTDQWGNIESNNYNGRAGEIVFLLNGKDYTSTMKVEQYNYEHADGEVIVNQSATKGSGVNIVFMGDCFDARDIATGKYLEGINEAIGHYFDIEPYKSYKDYFNIYTVIGMSPDSGMGTVNNVKDAKFGSQYSLNGITPNTAITYEYAMKAETVNESNLNKTLVVMVENTTDYGGICYMWGDGSAIAICPMSRDAYPYDFRGIVQHEAGGHGFAKLGDEYIYTNAFIGSCVCPNPHLGEFNAGKALGWYRNLSTNGDMKTVEWAHLIYHPDYSNIVDMYEGGYFHSRGIYRSEATSCMNNNIPYYSAIQRQEMVERIMKYAGLPFSLDDFYANDVRDASAASRSLYAPWTISTVGEGKQQAPKYMGDKPNLNK